jgi:hypothetical protein
MIVASTLEGESESRVRPCDRLAEFALVLIVIALGLANAWAGRFLINPDGVSYIDMAGAYIRHDWHAALNPLWSPLYPAVLAAGLKLLRPSPYWEFPAVHLINFCIYLAAFACFQFFWTTLGRYIDQQRHIDQEITAAALPRPAWSALGYTVFVISCIELLGMRLVVPDMCVAALVFVAAGLLLRARMGGESWRTCIALGVTLGLAYLAKSSLLPLSIPFVFGTWSQSAGFRNSAVRALTVIFGLAAVAGPYIATLSQHQGHLTYGDAAKLNYAWIINGVPNNWLGEIPSFGKPVHPHTRVLDYPAAYEYPKAGMETYPGWYDPAYWYEGVTPHFDLRQQVYRIFVDGQILFDLLFSRFQAPLIVGVLALSLCGGISLRRFAAGFVLLLPAVAAFTMYLLIWVEPRYIAPFVPLAWSALIAAVRLPNLPQARRFLVCITAGIALVTLVTTLESTAVEAYSTGREAPVQWLVAAHLNQAGIRPGDRVAAIGHINQCGWARLARVHLTAEIPHEAESDFRRASEAVRAAAMETLFRTGVKAIVSDQREASGCRSGWTVISGYSVCVA